MGQTPICLLQATGRTSNSIAPTGGTAPRRFGALRGQLRLHDEPLQRLLQARAVAPTTDANRTQRAGNEGLLPRASPARRVARLAWLPQARPATENPDGGGDFWPSVSRG